MGKLTFAALFFAVVLQQSAAAAAAAGGTVRSGPRPGEEVPGPFRPLNLTGPEAGRHACLYCKYGQRPVALVFARELTPAVAGLLARLDAEAAKPGAELGGYAVLLGDPDRLAEPARQMARGQNLRAVVLTAAEAAPPRYAVADDAAVTVVLYRLRMVQASHAFRAGELDDRATDAVLADVQRMLSGK
jgi:hypothetical protein